jgi:hypothetical protein
MFYLIQKILSEKGIGLKLYEKIPAVTPGIHLSIARRKNTSQRNAII